uniref:Uncharacterized protein n=1 Tax=Magallana gigas TaxID=29159 RepID=K1QW01_MAGGI
MRPSGRITVNNQIGSNNSIKHISSENEAETIVCNQMGQENKFSSRNKIQRAPKSFVCTQVGETNKIIIELDDQTRSTKILSIEGKGELRLTLHSSDPRFKEIAGRIEQLSIKELNEDEFLRENSIQVVSTQSACLIVDVRIKGPNVDIPLSMERLVECLMRRCNAFQVLSDNNVDELKIHGYYYQPGDYVHTTDLRLNFSLFSHVTLKLNKTIVDVDVFVSDSLKKLIEDSFQTDGIVFYLSPGSKVTEAIENNRFPELVQALLGEKNTKEQLKIKAVLKYDNGRNNSDSDPAIDITEEYERPTPEESIRHTIELARIRLLENEYRNDLFSLISSMTYWMCVINGPYEIQDIRILFKEIEDMIVGYTDIDEYKNIAYGIFFELLLSYRELEHDLCSEICDNYKQLDREGHELDIDNLYMWAKSLKHLGKTDVALKKIEEAIQLDSSDRKTSITTRTKCSREDIKQLRESLLFEMNQIPEQTSLDTEWLAGTNITLLQHMKERAQRVKEQHVKKFHRRPKKREIIVERTLTPEIDPSEYKRWKDVQENASDVPRRTFPQKYQTKERQEKANDFNVEIVERQKSESDSGQESCSESEEPQRKPFTYEAPEYRHFETESESFSDSGFDTFDEESQIEYPESTSVTKTLSNSELVVSGITLTDRCEASLHQKHKFETFKYQEFLSKEELIICLQTNKNRYKRCTIEIESAHKAVCTNLNVADEVKEIIISGRSKCGKVFTDDEVVVEILGESKAQKNYIPRLKLDLAKETKDNNIYGKIIGRLKKNRYEDLQHPVFICARDEFSEHSMRPLCKTVPKINISHTNCKHKYQVDLFSYDAERNVVEYRETLTIDQAHKNAYCFLVAMIYWENMYPFGLILKVINTKGDVKSGLGILRLQYRVPCQYSKEATDAAKLILQQKHQIDTRNKNVIQSFTICEGKQGALEAAYSTTLLESGLYRVGIHIVDPTSVIKKGDAIDKEAEKRGTDFYVNKDVPPVYMVPERISNELFNMEVGKVRETLTVFFDVPIDLSSDQEEKE